MKQSYYGAGTALAAALVLTGCVDNGYDLSDIDKTTEIKVVDLTLPVNIDAITLDDIINLDDDSQVKIRPIDGKDAYVVTESGEFHSDPITIGSFTASAPQIQPSHLVFTPMSGATRADLPSLSYAFHSFEPRDISLSATNIDSSIDDISEIFLTDGGHLNMELSIIPDMNIGDMVTMELTDLSMTIFRGLNVVNLPQGYAYDPASGKLTISRIDLSHEPGIKLEVAGVNLHQAGANIVNHELDYKGTVAVDGGMLTITANTSGSVLPDLRMPSFTVYTKVSDLVAGAIAGTLNYHLEGNGLDIAPIDLSDLPDFLAQDETNLLLSNPQLYIGITNPLYNQHLYFTSGFSLSSYHGSQEQTYGLDNNARVNIGYNLGEGPYNFELSPRQSNSVEGYPNAVHMPYTSLGNVLSGSGLPDKIVVNLLNPEMPSQKVAHFDLGVTYPGVQGTYDFFAPLSFKEGTVIIYSDTQDGWGSDDLDKMTISRLKVEFDASTNLPIGAELTAHPIDRSGNEMKDVTISKVNLKAMADNQHIELETTGNIKDLDGIRFRAYVQPASDNVLSPEMTITLSGLKATVSGSYITDFE